MGLICPYCTASIFRIIRDPNKNEWAVCLECEGYTIVTQLKEKRDGLEHSVMNLLPLTGGNYRCRFCDMIVKDRDHSCPEKEREVNKTDKEIYVSSYTCDKKH